MSFFYSYLYFAHALINESTSRFTRERHCSAPSSAGSASTATSAGTSTTISLSPRALQMLCSTPQADIHSMAALKSPFDPIDIPSSGKLIHRPFNIPITCSDTNRSRASCQLKFLFGRESPASPLKGPTTRAV